MLKVGMWIEQKPICRNKKHLPSDIIQLIVKSMTIH